MVSSRYCWMEVLSLDPKRLGIPVLSHRVASGSEEPKRKTDMFGRVG